MSKNEIIKRYVLFIVSLFFAALGVAFTKHGQLGVSPISSVANVMNCRFEMLSLGTWLIIWNCFLILGFGISLSVIANVIMNSGEAFVKAIADTIHKEFGNVKIVFDIFCVIIALILSLVFFDFTIVGTREGTIFSALFTGIAVKFWSAKLKMPLEKILSESN